jgi:CHAT domain-containing protein
VRQALRDTKRPDVKQLARTVEQKVTQPLRPLLGGTRRVFISPDGALNLIPFAALVDEQNRYLLERYEFSYLTSGRDLLRLQVKQPGQRTALVVANPDFEAGPGQAGQMLTVRPNKTAGGATQLADYLPLKALAGTREEARALKALLPTATVLTGAQATEAALKQTRAPQILHIATHGFFLPDLGTGTGRGLKAVGVTPLAPASPRVENPLLHTGLALAGANRLKSGEDDGILTALEASGLDL